MEDDRNNNLGEIVINYFKSIDNGTFNNEHLNQFSDNFLLEFPKFGAKSGITSLSEFGQKVASNYKNMKHHIKPKDVIVSENRVFVEGYLSGETKNDIKWPDNKISFGKFCTVFEFENTKISRMSIYSDPDFASQDNERVTIFK